MKKILVFIAVIVLLTSCQNSSKEASKSELNQEQTFIALSEFQSKASEFLKKEVQVQGIVDHICKHGGKKIVLVNNDARVHVLSDTRFDESIVGKEIKLVGIVEEDRTDETSLLEIEEKAINIHSEEADDEIRQERMISYVNTMRDSLKRSGVDHFSEYHLQFVSFSEVEE